MFEMDDKNLPSAIKIVDTANEIIPFPPSILLQAEWLANDGQYNKALEYIAMARRTAENEVLPYFPNPYLSEINKLKGRVESERKANNR